MLETRSIVFLLLISASTTLCLGQLDTVCNSSALSQCDACINASPLCSWCPILPGELRQFMSMDIFDNYTYVNFRCRDESTFPLKCSDTPTSILHGQEQNPETKLDRTEDEELSRNAEGEEIIQVRPQRVVIDLRQGDTATFNMSFISLRNTPLDVYFLADVSSSLQLTLRSLRTDISVIAESLRQISTGFAIGFGSFVDKRTLPYAHNNLLKYVDENRNVTDCRAFGPQCVPTYLYHHSIPLMDNVTKFQEVLNDVSQLSGNIDEPEASMDALMQAIVCLNEIGWRNDALKMIFLVTDRTYHVAGDGKLAGIVRPNSGTCNLAPIPGNEFNEFEYTRSLDEDYVSLGQLHAAIVENRIIPTIVIQYHRLNPDQSLIISAYNSLSNILPRLLVRAFDTSNFGGDTSNVTQALISIIQDSYGATVQQVQVNQPRNIEGYRFDITPICDSMDAQGACRVDFDETVNFTISVTLEDCSLAQGITRQLSGGPYRFTTIQLEPICSCPCSAQDQQITNNSVCTMGQGNQICGVCECDGNFTGPECQCTEQFNICTTDEDCNGFECDPCGFCLCGNSTFGDNCICNTTTSTCPIRTVDGVDLPCSGPDRGTCDCEECACNLAPLSELSYFGVGNTAADFNAVENNCECDPDDCYNPNFPGGVCYDQVNKVHSSELCGCSGCNCIDPFYAYRNTCVNTNFICNLLMDCVTCFLDAPCTEQPCSLTGCGSACLSYQFEQLSAEEVLTTVVPTGYRDSCEVDYTGCTVQYYFSTDANDPIIVENSRDYSCPASTLPWIIAGSLVGAILLLGLLALIILKICLVFLERVEYRKFTQELKEADFAPHENPLYITPQQDYQNPIRRTSSRRSQ